MGEAGAERFVSDDVFEEGDVGFDAADAEFAEGAVHALAGGGEVAALCGEFDEHGIVEWGDDGAGIA